MTVLFTDVLPEKHSVECLGNKSFLDKAVIVSVSVQIGVIMN
jgi:hypothetical protein